MRINRAIIVLSLIIVQLSHFVYAGNIKGTVSDKGSGDFLPGANVFLEGTNYGTSSDRAGNYTINGVPDGDYTLIGEEFFTASAYLSKKPELLGSIKGQDIVKLLVMAMMVLTVVLNGLFQTGWINFDILSYL